MKLIFDRQTLQKTDAESPMTFAVSVPDDLPLTKTVTKTRMIPQEPKHIYETVDTIVQVPVTHEYEPKMTTETRDIEVYTEVDGEIVMTVEPREFQVPVEGVFLKPVFDEDGNIVSYEDSEAGTYEVLVDTVQTEVIKDEYVEVPDIEETYEEVVELTDLNEIMQAKFSYITTQNNCIYAYADEFTTEDDLDLAAEGHSANTGCKILQVLPHGQCQTKPIKLDVSAKTFRLYHESDLQFEMFEVVRIESQVKNEGFNVEEEVSEANPEFLTVETITLENPQKFTDNQCIFPAPITEFVLRMINDTDKSIMAMAYSIMYNEEVI